MYTHLSNFWCKAKTIPLIGGPHIFLVYIIPIMLSTNSIYLHLAAHLLLLATCPRLQLWGSALCSFLPTELASNNCLFLSLCLSLSACSLPNYIMPFGCLHSLYWIFNYSPIYLCIFFVSSWKTELCLLCSLLNLCSWNCAWHRVNT